jgi:hypothetical protein
LKDGTAKAMSRSATMRCLPLLLAASAATGCYTAPDAPPFAQAAFRCGDGSRIEIRFDERIGAAFLALPEGGEARLEPLRAGSGFWYRSTDYELRGKGREVLFSRGGAAPVSCVAE